MSYTVFYSWQDDTDKGVNRHFLKEVLAASVNKIDVKLDERPSVISDTTGVPGSASIVETVFDRIKNCDIYVPDLTFVAKKGKKLVSNPNVLIELGFAVAVVGDQRIIPILNENYGNVSEIYFNRKHLRFPVTYNLSPKCTAEKKRSVKNKLINDMADYIQLAIKECVLKKEIEIINEINSRERCLLLSDNAPGSQIARMQKLFKILKERAEKDVASEAENFIKFIREEYLPFFIKNSNNYVTDYNIVIQSLSQIKMMSNRNTIIKLIESFLDELKFSGLAPVYSLNGYLLTYNKIKNKALSGRVNDLLDLINFLNDNFFPFTKMYYGGNSKYNELWLEIFGEDGIINQVRSKWKYSD